MLIVRHNDKEARQIRGTFIPWWRLLGGSISIECQLALLIAQLNFFSHQTKTSIGIGPRAELSAFHRRRAVAGVEK
jgi:hypothetical protein